MKNHLEALFGCSLVKRQSLADSAKELGATQDELLSAIKYKWHVDPQSFYKGDAATYFAAIEKGVRTLASLN